MTLSRVESALNDLIDGPVTRGKIIKLLVAATSLSESPSLETANAMVDRVVERANKIHK